MKYEISKEDGLYCVYESERLGLRIVAAYETLKDAKEAIEEFKREGAK